MNAYASLFLVLRTAHSKAPVRHFLFQGQGQDLSFSPPAIHLERCVRFGKEHLHEPCVPCTKLALCSYTHQRIFVCTPVRNTVRCSPAHTDQKPFSGLHQTPKYLAEMLAHFRLKPPFKTVCPFKPSRTRQDMSTTCPINKPNCVISTFYLYEIRKILFVLTVDVMLELFLTKLKYKWDNYFHHRKYNCLHHC